MTLDPYNFSQPLVHDDHYLATCGGVANLYIQNLDEETNCLKTDSYYVFQKGPHLVVQLTHEIGINFAAVKNRENGQVIFHKITSCLFFFKGISKKLELTEPHMYIRGILAYVIGYEEKLMMRFHERIATLNSFDPLNFSFPVVKDDHYYMTFGAVPKFYISESDTSMKKVKTTLCKEFKSGPHYVVQCTHDCDIDVENARLSKYLALQLFQQIKFSINFFTGVMLKLDLSEENMYARGILSHAISCEEKMLLILQERIAGYNTRGE